MTMEDVFAEEVWLKVKNADGKRKITLQALMTMSSGLVESKAKLSVAVLSDNGVDVLQNTLADVLNHADYSAADAGRFNYLPATSTVVRHQGALRNVAPRLCPGPRRL